ncbi:MAG: ATP-binding protein [Verrucomicrobiota bacterium]|nr:ATP-binding protein [Verrucomicrobiota bacterium]
MLNLRDRPIRQKIMLVIMLISGVVLLLAFAALFYFQAYTLRQQSAHELAVVGEITAHNCAAAVMFKDEDAAAQILGGLKTMPQIVSARLELMDRQRLAFFGAARDEIEIRSARPEAGFQIHGNRILLAQPVLLNGKREGTLYLLADLHAMTAQLLRLFGGIFALVLAASLLCAFVLSSRFQRFITQPILSLAGTARTIADQKDYSVRAPKVCGDEVGFLTDAFNQMLAQIQSQDSALQSAQGKLRDQVDALQREISERQRAEAAHARLTAILEATPDIVINADPSGKALYLNHAGRELLGLGDGDDLSALKIFDLQPEWARAIVRESGFPIALENGSWAGETAIYDHDGAEIHVSQVLIAHRNSKGGVEYLSTVMRDMTERREAEEALRVSQQKLLETSRLAGMAEVATGVLHNVGNVLNSVNVSASLVVEKLRRSKAPKLAQAAALLTRPNGDLGEYLTKDANGQKLPGYLAKLGEFFVAENAELLVEADQLGRNIEHIKEVVAMQQSYAKVSGVFENLPPHQLVEDALAMNIGAFQRHQVVVERQFSAVPHVRVDRHKVLLILINLLRNAKYALDKVKHTDKRITVSIFAAKELSAHIVVTDNGIGISEENLTRVFAHGFTTKEEGHGFGLHSGALAARAMGGSLSVASAGPGHGAAFTLELPLAATTPKT